MLKTATRELINAGALAAAAKCLRLIAAAQETLGLKSAAIASLRAHIEATAAMAPTQTHLALSATVDLAPSWPVEPVKSYLTRLRAALG